MNTENNKIIAEFMGLFDKIITAENLYSWSDAPFFYTTEYNKEKVINNISKYSKYHSDWNWLMKVVEKIEVLGYNFQITSKDATVLQNHAAIYQSLIYRIDGTTKIQATYQTILEFIKWYNLQNS